MVRTLLDAPATVPVVSSAARRLPLGSQRRSQKKLLQPLFRIVAGVIESSPGEGMHLALKSRPVGVTSPQLPRQ
jgi:hypothetical protein